MKTTTKEIHLGTGPNKPLSRKRIREFDRLLKDKRRSNKYFIGIDPASPGGDYSVMTRIESHK